MRRGLARQKKKKSSTLGRIIFHCEGASEEKVDLGAQRRHARGSVV